MKSKTNRQKGLPWNCFSLSILFLLQIKSSTPLSKNSGKIGSAIKTFIFNGQHHQLPTVKIKYGDTKHILENDKSCKFPNVSHPKNEEVEEVEEVLFEAFVTATYPLYSFFDFSTDADVINPSLHEMIEQVNETTFSYLISWDFPLSYAKWKNTSVEFRSNVDPFFGISVHHFFDKNEDTVTVYKNADIPDHYRDYFRRLRDAKNSADEDCEAYLFIRQTINLGLDVSERMYSCIFANTTTGKLRLSTSLLSRVPIFLDGSRAAQHCVQWCENNEMCRPEEMWVPEREYQWTNFGYCEDPDSKKNVHFPQIYASLPQGRYQSPEIYFNLTDVRLDKVMTMNPIEEYHQINSTLEVRCNLSFVFFTLPIRFALRFKQTENLNFLPITHDISSIAQDDYAYIRTLTYKIKLDRLDIDRIFCIAPIRGSFHWINTSVEVQILEPAPPNFIFDNDVTEANVLTNSFRKEFPLGSTNKTLNCRARGEPSPHITWTWNGRNLIESKGKYTPHELTWSQLVFTQIYKYSEGKYICTATNPHGVARATFDLIVAGNDSSDATSLAVSIGAPVLAFVLIAVVIAGVILIKRTKRYAIVLTKKEYQDFLHGSLIKNISDPNCETISKAFDKKFIIAKECLELDLDSVLGSGQYGVVIKGSLKKCENGSTVVAIKTTKKDGDVMYVRALMSEAKVMAHIGDGRNVVAFFGACIENLRKGKQFSNMAHFIHGEIYVAVEFCENGNLLERLRREQEMLLNNRSTEKAILNPDNQILNLPPILLNILIQWSLDIASGMAFISSKNVIHGDLAARNVLLTKNDLAKISDFGLSRLLLNDCSVYTKKTNVPMPWKWMALESLTKRKFSLQSDTWAFGITLWELFSLGDSPYRGCEHNKEFIQELTNGFRPPKPKYASDELYNLMQNCWNKNPQMRPQMSIICDFIEQKQIHLRNAESNEACNSNYSRIEKTMM